MLVENRGGAGGILGADAVAKARPDGYTLLIANVGTQSINPSLYPKLPYNPDTAFAPVSLICELPFVLMASPSFAPKTVKELVDFAKANPDKVTYASSGSGGSPHLTAEIFQLATGTRLLHVPYKGGGPAMTDLMAGHVDLLFASVLESSGSIKQGKLKGLAVTHAKRSPALPDVPTLAEAGVKNAESGSWIALLAPAGTPAAIVDKLAADVKAVVADAEVREKLVAQGAVPQSSTPAQLQAPDRCRPRPLRSDHPRQGPKGGVMPPVADRSPLSMATRCFAMDALTVFAAALFEAVEMEHGKAATVGRLLVLTDMMGRRTHGLAMAPTYLAEIAKGGMRIAGEPDVVRDTGATVVWDGGYCRGCGPARRPRALGQTDQADRIQARAVTPAPEHQRRTQ